MTKKILAIDDENDVLLVIKTALQSEGFDVETASDGAGGFDKAARDKPDLIILDVMMPGLSGFDVLKKMRADERTSRIPVIMLTGVSEKSKIAEAIAAGTDYYIVKPFEFQNLVEKVNIALNPANTDPLDL